MICYLGTIYYSSLSIPGKLVCLRATDQAGSLPDEYPLGIPTGAPVPAAGCWQRTGTSPKISPLLDRATKISGFAPPREIWGKAASINQHELSCGMGSPKVCPRPRQSWMSPSREPGPGYTRHDLGAPAQPAPHIPGAAETFHSQLRSNHLFFKT